MGEGLVKLVMCNDVPGHWVDVSRSGIFPDKPQVSALPITTTDHAVTERSTSGSLGQCFSGSQRHLAGVQKELCYSSTCPPNVRVCHCTWLSFTRPSPMLILQVTNTGVRRPGYEARTWIRLNTVEPLLKKTPRIMNPLLIGHLMESDYSPPECIPSLQTMGGVFTGKEQDATRGIYALSGMCTK